MLKLDHIHIRCIDLAAAEQWYTEVMGGTVVKRGEVPGMPIVRIELGGQIIALSPAKEGMEVEPSSGRPRWGVWQISYQVDDIGAAYQELKARGAQFSGEPVAQTPAVSAAFIKAPDGVEIELVQFT